MDEPREVTLADVRRAVETHDPRLADMIVRLAELEDPPAGRPEVPEDAPEGEPTTTEPAEPAPVPPDRFTLESLRTALAPKRLAAMTATERKNARREAWAALASAENAPPRVLLGDILLALDDSGDVRHRAALVDVLGRIDLRWGPWGAVKALYKRAEARHDALLFGVIAYRLDATRYDRPRGVIDGELGVGTFIYLRRRVWRYLRHLGGAVPELFPAFVGQVLKHYPARFPFQRSWVAAQVWGRKGLVGKRRGSMARPPKDVRQRAFDAAWRLSPDPLLRLLEDAQADAVAEFAIAGLEKDFPEATRNVAPAWLARLAQRPLAKVHDFVVALLKDDPALHQSKLRGLGLHDMVVAFLESDSDAARKYAVEYARAHAPDLAVDLLIRLADDGAGDVKKLAVERLRALSGAQLGLRALARMAGVSALEKDAVAKLKASFKPADISADLFRELFLAGDEAKDAMLALWSAAKRKVQAAS